MTKLLVFAGIPVPCVLDEIQNNMGVSVYLYNSNFLGMLRTAYKNAKEKFSFSHLRELLKEMPEWDETVVKQAFSKSIDFTQFTNLIPRDMDTSLMNESYMNPVMTVLSETKGKGLISGENTDGFARLLRTYPNVHGTASFPFPVGDKMIHVDSGRTPENFPTIEGISHVILGFPVLSDDDLFKIQQKLLAGTPRLGKTKEEREVYAQEHRPIIITAEDVLTAGGMVRLYL